MSPRNGLLWLVVFGLSLCGACGGGDDGKAQGESCIASYQCSAPLVCSQSATCQPVGSPGTADRDEDCDATDDCRVEYICGSGGFCTLPGSSSLGAGCQGTEDCFRGLVCSGLGLCADPGDPGTAGHGDPCVEAAECEYGLFCSESDATCHRLGGTGDSCEDHDQCRQTHYCDETGICVERLSDGAACVAAAQCAAGTTCWQETCTPLPQYSGVSCEDPALDLGPFRVLFEVPPADITGPMEFYRLPFPNDIRLRNGRVDLSGHPDPGDLVPGEVVTKYLDAIEADNDGFGLSTVSFFRFSKAVSYATVSLSGDGASVLFMNIDPGSIGYGERHSGLGFSASTAPGRYICHNWMAVHPMAGYPLRQATTYAVLLLDSITNDASEPATPDDDFAAMLDNIAPAGANLQAAWLAYQPLRDFLADTTLPAESQVAASAVVAASVFTTMDPDRRPPAFRSVIRNDPTVPAPDVADVTLCEGAALSPCDDGLTGAEHLRGCMGEDLAVHEIHGRLATPLFQQGTPPYADSGGDIAYTVDGSPLVQGQQDVCFGLSVPKGAAMPAAGWPVVIYLHGTGGSFRSHFDNGVAMRLADVDLGGGVTTQMAVMGIDQVVHGARREGDSTHPNLLFFNFTNPQAAKGNTLQGAADLFQLVRVVEGFVQQVNSVGEVRLDPDRIYFFGHSQGVNTGGLAVVFEPAIRGVVYSGGGALLMESLLNKTNPVDLTGVLQFALADADVGFNHPMLSLLQLYFEPVDTINYLAQLFMNPVAGVEARHALFSYGLGDTYSPNATGRAMIRSAGAHLIRPVLDTINYVGELDAPVTGNRWGGTLTEGAVQLDTDGTYDGHFVLLRNPDGQALYSTFLGTMDTDPQHIPTIPVW